MSTAPAPVSLQTEERPDSRLMLYYVLKALVVPPLFPLVILPLYFRYHTLRYRFDAQGVSMRWGILFRREILLNYARLQDIQIRANLVERWLGLARIELQTAAGNAGAEMTLEGFTHFEAIRDFLYQRMRGANPTPVSAQPSVATSDESLAPHGTAANPGASPELARTLRDIATELRQLRETLASQRPPHA